MKAASLIASIFSASMLRILSLLVLSLCLGGCSGLFFFPDKEWRRTPAQLGIDYQDIELSSVDGTSLSAWWLLPPEHQPVKGTVLFLHGNAENISTHIGSVYWLPEQGYRVLMLDYRGYGKSEGVPSLPAVFADIAAAFDWLLARPDIDERPLYLLGQSLGASLGGFVVASRPDYRQQLDAVVLDAGFPGFAEMAQQVASRSWLTWPLQYPARWSMPTDYDLLDHVGNIAPTPLLIIHGRQDAVVPYRYGEQLFAAAAAPKSMLSYDGPHIGTFRDLENRELLLQFFRQGRLPAP